MDLEKSKFSSRNFCNASRGGVQNSAYRQEFHNQDHNRPIRPYEIQLRPISCHVKHKSIGANSMPDY